MEVELTFGEWLRDQLHERGWEQRDLAERIDVAPSAVSRWATDVGPPSIRNSDRIAEALGIEINEVRRRVGLPLRKRNAESSTPYLSPVRPDSPRGTEPSGNSARLAIQPGIVIHIIGRAGDGATTGVAVEGFEHVNAGAIAGIIHPAFVIAAGDSMAGRNIHDGDKILIDRGAEPEPGEVVVVSIDDQLLLKEWWPDGDDVILRAAAPGITPLRFDQNDDSVELVGVARRILSWKDI